MKLSKETKEERTRRFERAFGVTREELRGMTCYLTYASGVKLGLDPRVLGSWTARYNRRKLEVAELLQLLIPYPGENMKDPSEVVEELSCASTAGVGKWCRTCGDCPFDRGVECGFDSFDVEEFGTLLWLRAEIRRLSLEAGR